MSSSEFGSDALDPGTFVEVDPPRGGLPSDTGFRITLKEEPTPQRDTAGQLERRAVKHEHVYGAGEGSRDREPIDVVAPEPCRHIHIRCGPCSALRPAAIEIGEARPRRAEVFHDLVEINMIGPVHAGDCAALTSASRMGLLTSPRLTAVLLARERDVHAGRIRSPDLLIRGELTLTERGSPELRQGPGREYGIVPMWAI